MSLFRKQPQSAQEQSPEPVRLEPAPIVTKPTIAIKPTASAAAAEPRLFINGNVDIDAIYRSATLSPDELDRVARAEELLHHVPKKAAQTREIVEATFRAFGVDQVRIIEAARKQLETLETFVRFSHDQTQRILDANQKRVAELETEIEACRVAASQATREGEERARTVNHELLKVQGVLEFFGDEVEGGLDEATLVKNYDEEASVGSTSTPTTGKRPQRPSVGQLR